MAREGVSVRGQGGNATHHLPEMRRDKVLVTNPLKFAAKFLAGALIILLVVGPLAYGVYGSKSLAIGCTAALVHWVLGTFYTRLEELDKRLDARFTSDVITGIYLGLAMGFGVGLGADLGEGIGKSLGIPFVAILAQWFTIGLTLGLSIGLLMRIAEFVAGNLAVEGDQIPKPDFPGKLGSLLSVLLKIVGFAFVFVAFGVPFGVAEATGGGLLQGFITGCAVALFVWFALVVIIFVGLNPAALPMALFQGAAAGLFFGVVAGVFVGIGIGSGTGSEGFVAASLGGVLGLCVGFLTGIFVGRRIRPMLNVFEGLAPYLRVMLVPVVAFAVGYILVAVLFAGLFAAVYRVDPEGAFSGLPANPSFGDFLFFSVNAISAAKFSGMEADSQLTRTIASVETIAGIGWTVVVFAGVIAYLQPRFTEIYGRRSLTRDEKMARARRWVDELLNEGNLDLVDEILSSDADIHVNVRDADTAGAESIKQFVTSLRSAVPDLKIVVNSQEANYLSYGTRTSWTGRGIHQHQFQEFLPTGEQVTLTGTATFDIGMDGKASKAEMLLYSWAPQKKHE